MRSRQVAVPAPDPAEINRIRRDGTKPLWYEFAPLAIALALMAIACAISVQSFVASERLRAKRDASGESMQRLWTLLLSLNDSDAVFRQYVLTGSPVAEEGWKQGQDRIRVDVANLKKSLGVSADADRVAELEGLIAEKRRVNETVVQLRKKKDLAGAGAAAESNFGKLAATQAGAVLRQIETAQRAKALRANREIHRYLLRGLLVGGAGLGQLLGLLIWEYFSLRASATRIRNLRVGIFEAEDQYRRLSAKYQEEQEATKAAIARIVHDQLGQALVAIKLEADHAARMLHAEPRTDCLARVIERIRSTANDTANAARDIAIDLRPPILDLCGIGTALEWLAGEVRARTSLQITVRTAACELTALTAEDQTGMFRIAEEALNNAVRHARAHSVSITLGREIGTVVMQIADDGVGIRREEFRSAHALGLLGMQERAEMLGANLEIANAPSGGARIKLSMPERAPAPAS